MLNLRMESYRIRFVALVMVGLMAMPLRAGVIPGRWEKVSTLPVASPITVELKDGDRIKGHYEGLSVTDVMLVTHFSRAVIPKEDIEAITTQPEDSLSNGTLIGAGVGAGLMGVWAAAASSDLSALGAVWMLTTGLAIGAGLGAVGDAIEKPKPIVLYEAP